MGGGRKGEIRVFILGAELMNPDLTWPRLVHYMEKWQKKITLFCHNHGIHLRASIRNDLGSRV